jgi:hypothetical protein
LVAPLDLVGVPAGVVGERAAEARVSPLSLIARQIHKPNILVLLDTSGSLTGVPGGTFDTPDEVGVDCDDGNNCRGGGALGVCAQSGKGCYSDDDCAVDATCKVDAQSCGTDADCAPAPGSCNQLTCNGSNQNCVHAACFTSSDCPASTTGTCVVTHNACNPVSTCSAVYKCTYGSNTCSSTSTPCAAYSVCQNSSGGLSSQQCATSNDCPLKSTGTCSVGGAACSSGNVSTCAKVCPDHSTVCTSDSQCGVCSKGSGSLAGGYCSVGSNCSRSGANCSVTSGSCSVNNNSCALPHYTCTVSQANNPCLNTNPCVGPANTCGPLPTNNCVAPTAGDVCNAGGTTTNASRMCRISQLKCSKDSDCTTAGDACGPATSRIVIAKRVLSEIVTNNSNIANFGLMTFYQNGYFPYYKLTGASTVSSSTFLTQGRLQVASCFDATNGPASTCTIDSVVYTLTGGNNSLYKIGGTGQQVGNNWCGQFCAISGAGTGTYQGSYYSYSTQTGTVTSTKSTQTTYQGKSITLSGSPYRYYDSYPNYYNSGAIAPPVGVPNCGSYCSSSCGARWDTQLAPFLDTSDDPAKASVMAAAIYSRMQPASYGGLIAYGGTPTGCALRNDVSSTTNASAYDYMALVKKNDTVTCRQNYVMLITDGEANGPGDNSCSSNACAAADPRGAGCTCKAVLAAEDLKAAGVRTLVVGFSGDVSAGTGRITNDNIARAGGTDRGSDGVAPFAYDATSEADLLAAIQEAIYDAAKGSYSTSPPAASAGIQLQGKITVGTYALDSRVDFPSWKGHLIAYDTSAGSPMMVWDAAVQLGNMDWKTRRVYTSDSSNNLVMIQVNSNGTIANKTALHTLGLGASDDEAEKIARWVLGDPTMGNPAILGAMVNSTPIDVGQPGADLNPGGIDFSNKYVSRPHITYVGSDDGMVHGFYTSDTVIGGAAKPAGSEAFAYLPPEMLSTATKIYAQGGQVADPTAHIFGLASSPKVKNLCASNCTDNAKAAWKTVLAMTDGYGGSETFMLDITDPTANPPFSLIWHSATSPTASTYNNILGQTISVPAFFYSDTPTLDDYRVLFTSGYPVTAAGANDQGHYIISASAATGQILSQQKVSPAGGCGTTPEFTMLTDVGTARDYQVKNQLLAGYAGDTWGNLWRFTPSATPTAVLNLGCQHPLHFAPTVVQLDRDDVTNLPHQIYLVQSTNSPLDDVTKNFDPSHIVITRDIFKDGAVSADQTFGVNGTVSLSVGVSPQLCGVSDLSGTVCQTQLPSNARPLGTPLAILKQDGSGFLILSNWYAPDPQGCSKGTTYLQIHQVSVPSGVVTMKQALRVSDEPVSSPIVAGNKIVIITSTGPVVLSGNVTQTFVAGQSSPSMAGGAAEPFKILGWSESY